MKNFWLVGCKEVAVKNVVTGEATVLDCVLTVKENGSSVTVTIAEMTDLLKLGGKYDLEITYITNKVDPLTGRDEILKKEIKSVSVEDFDYTVDNRGTRTMSPFQSDCGGSTNGTYTIMFKKIKEVEEIKIPKGVSVTYPQASSSVGTVQILSGKDFKIKDEIDEATGERNTNMTFDAIIEMDGAAHLSGVTLKLSDYKIVSK